MDNTRGNSSALLQLSMGTSNSCGMVFWLLWKFSSAVCPKRSIYPTIPPSVQVTCWNCTNIMYRTTCQSPFFQNMSWTLHNIATDLGDKIFALLGLYHDGLRLVPVPNYRQSLEAIISDISRSMISLTRSLDFVYLKGSCNTSSQQFGLPTWAPNRHNI
jgi:hypothetical protein